ncbi:MAG: hypothetical protein WCJ40_20590 [Planctomycetota bacterium]
MVRSRGSVFQVIQHKKRRLECASGISIEQNARGGRQTDVRGMSMARV